MNPSEQESVVADFLINATSNGASVSTVIAYVDALSNPVSNRYQAALAFFERYLEMYSGRAVVEIGYVSGSYDTYILPLIAQHPLPALVVQTPAVGPIQVTIANATKSAVDNTRWDFPDATGVVNPSAFVYERAPGTRISTSSGKTVTTVTPYRKRVARIAIPVNKVAKTEQGADVTLAEIGTTVSLRLEVTAHKDIPPTLYKSMLASFLSNSSLVNFITLQDI